MKISLSQNIRTLRRERGMTQELLAEAMGVTVGAVHKWETGASMPEIRLLLELADLFGVSVDALLGYEMHGSTEEGVTVRITELLRAKDHASALCEAEKALLRFPNSFAVVYCCARAYELTGVENGDGHALRRAIELLERCVPLLSQNSDAKISEVTIRSDAAVCRIKLGDIAGGIEMLRRHNAGGINDSLLGLICSRQEPFDREATEKHLMGGMGGMLTDAIRCMSGYVCYYSRTGNTGGALEAARWLTGFLGSLKTSGDVCYLDRIIAALQAAEAACLLAMGRQDEALRRMADAHGTAAAFDAAPVYDLRAMKFIVGDTGKNVASDDLGQSAMAAIENVLSAEAGFRPALELWQSIAGERGSCGNGQQ